ncbi:MAG: hypothetical protein ABI538_11610, partial [Pseudoxanthomonas sp.]
MRYAIVTETYPPEINGVALTVQGLEQGLRARGHEVMLVRPRQDGDCVLEGSWNNSKSTPPPQSLDPTSISPALSAREEVYGDCSDTVLVRGAGLPRYPGLKFGLPAT